MGSVHEQLARGERDLGALGRGAASETAAGFGADREEQLGRGDDLVAELGAALGRGLAEQGEHAVRERHLVREALLGRERAEGVDEPLVEEARQGLGRGVLGRAPPSRLARRASFARSAASEREMGSS